MWHHRHPANPGDASALSTNSSTGEPCYANPQIVINIQGGVIWEVFCSGPLAELTVVDWDTEPGTCPECGEYAKGTFETVPGLALLNFVDDGEAEYFGQTDVCWDMQATDRDEQGRATLMCPAGHTWQAAMDEQCSTTGSGERDGSLTTSSDH